MHILTNQPQRLRRCMRDMAVDLPQRQRSALRKRRPKAERRRIDISRLLFKLSPINRPSIQPRRSPRLQPALPQTQPLQALAQQNTGWLTTPPRRILLLPTMNQPIQKRPSSNNRRPGIDHPPIPQLQPTHNLAIQRIPRNSFECLNSGCPISGLSDMGFLCRILHNQIHNFSLLNKQILLPLKHFTHLNPIERLIALRPRRPNGRPPTRIQQPKLNPTSIRNLTHHATQRIHLTHKMSLGDPIPELDDATTRKLITGCASTSRTRCPLAIPPIAGLQLICAIKSRFSVKIAVRSPIRAAATAASHPACPAPTTTTSYCSVKLTLLF